ncbi:phosphoribosyltransferase-like protein [Actinophytocola sp.]|uniref:phosphoribosyltransferase-like protein n=1 Tax=Actinophytocola sp. TaxID=1872138 RepID=UPI003BB8CC32
MEPRRPSQTARGTTWLENFSEPDRPAAELLIDSLHVVDSTTIRMGLREQIDSLAGQLLPGTRAVLLPILSEEDITTSNRFKGRHVAYMTFLPGDPISSTPGSEGLVGHLIRDFTGDRPGREPSLWLHPSTDIDGLQQKRCHVFVLVTDYSGSGTQVQRYANTLVRHPRIRSWRSFGWIKIIVVAYSVSAAAHREIERTSSIDRLLVATPAPSFETAQWTEEERKQIARICRRYLAPSIHDRAGLGFSGSAGLFVMHTGVPNNTPEILRSKRRGWHRFFDGPIFPPDLATELGGYAPQRDLVEVVNEANQPRLSRAFDSGRVRRPVELLLAILALIGHSSHTETTIAHRLNISEVQVRRYLDFLAESGFITLLPLRVTVAGRAELVLAKRMDRVATAHLEGSPVPYYPQRLR